MECVSEEAIQEEAGKTEVRWKKYLTLRAMTHWFGWPRVEDPQNWDGLFEPSNSTDSN